MEVISLKLSEITPYENNPRKKGKAVEAVKISIKKYGFRVPVIVNKDKILVCGHTRLEAAKILGLEEIPAIFAEDLTDEQVKAFRIADNKVSEFSTWDLEKLEKEIEGLDEDEFISRYFSRYIGDETQKTETFVNKELELDGFDDEQFKYECPCCGFRFN